MTPRLAFILLLATLASVSAYAASDEAFEGMRPPVATRDGDRSIRIQTAGTEFSLDLPENRIRITQRIPTTRPLGTLEGLDLSQVQPGQYDLICLPIKFHKGDGSPSRCLIRPQK